MGSRTNNKGRPNVVPGPVRPGGPCGVQILSQRRDLGFVQGLPDHGVLKMNTFK